MAHTPLSCGVILGGYPRSTSCSAYLGRPDESTRYLGLAQEQYARAGGAALLRRIDAPTNAQADRGSPKDGRLHPDGQLWLIEWRGLRSTVADAKGVRDLVVLLSRPGQAVPVLELVAAAAGGPPAAAAGADLCPVLDDQTRRSYRRRLAKSADLVEQVLDDRQ